jgi:hypothetical protein
VEGISRKTALALSVLALLSLPIGMWTAGAHTQTYKTNMSIHYDKHGDSIWGHLGTSSFCQQGRTVQVFKDGVSIGSTVSGHAGMWSMGATGDGGYQAVATQSVSTGYEHNHTCLAGSSKTISVP